MGLDVKKLNAAQAELDKKSGSKNWIQLSKITAPVDFRIMDPLPSMGGIYYVEVPMWWINGTRIISPKLYGINEPDPIQKCVDDAKAAKDPDVLKLLNAKDETKGGVSRVTFKTEYWVPGLKFNWDVDAQGNIRGIYAADGTTIDPALVERYIEDGKWKIASMGIQALKAINKIATSRGGFKMTNQKDGFNVILSKAGIGRETVYSALPDSLIVPIPEKYYTDDKMIDPFEVAQSMMFTAEYMDMVIGKYLYGEECPEKPGDEHYANPEIREKLKNRIGEEAETEDTKAPARQRPGRVAHVANADPANSLALKTAATRTAAAAEPVVDDKAAKIAAAKALLVAAESEAGTAPVDAAATHVPTRGRGPAPAVAATTVPPKRGGRRNISEDLASV